LVGSKIEEENPELQCAYIACGYKAGQAEPNGSLRNCTASCNPNKLWQAIEEFAATCGASQITFILHYSGYGYHASGAPDWLADAWEHRPKLFANAPIVTFFHELYASGKPWTKAFWNSHRQRAIALRIARNSGALLTNRSHSAAWLAQQTGKAPGAVAHLAICSNVGEPLEIVPWKARDARAVLFGGTRFKDPFLKRHAGALIEMCRRMSVETVVDIGTPAKLNPQIFHRSGIHFEQTGWLNATDVSKLLMGSQFGLIDYYPGFIAKSGVLAAAAAHGIVPVVLRDLNGEPDGFRLGLHCLHLNSITSQQPDLVRSKCPSISESIRHWYESHRRSRHADAIVHHLSTQIPKTCSPAC
jgi:hypothetical protein